MWIAPHGDEPGFIHIITNRLLGMPDRRGNNRFDSFHKILLDDRVSLLFLVLGVAETLRVKGRAMLSHDMEMGKNVGGSERAPLALLVEVQEVFFHCSRAIRRSRLWDATRHVAPGTVPSVREIMAEIRARGEK